MLQIPVRLCYVISCFIVVTSWRRWPGLSSFASEVFWVEQKVKDSTSIRVGEPEMGIVGGFAFGPIASLAS